MTASQSFLDSNFRVIRLIYGTHILVDRKLARLIFGGTLAAVSLLYYCAGGAKGSPADAAAQAKMIQQAQDIAQEQADAIKLANDPGQ